MISVLGPIFVAFTLHGPANSATSSCEEDVTLSFGGDYLLHGLIWRNNADDGDGSGLAKGLSEVSEIFQKSDISHVNLEGPVAAGIDRNWRQSDDERLIYTDFPRFNYKESSIKSLALSGVEIASGANNHSYDRGPIGVLKTLDAFSMNGMEVTGIRKIGSSEHDFYRVVNRKGIKIAYISCTEHLNGKKDPDNLVLNCGGHDGKIMTRLIGELLSTQKADAVIVNPHWGQEGEIQANQTQRRLARKFLHAGAIAVVGTHPHVLQEFEVLPQPDGTQKFIAYSLGNLLAAQGGLERNLTAILTLRLGRMENMMSIKAAEVVPAMISHREHSKVKLIENKNMTSISRLLKNRIPRNILRFRPENDNKCS